LLDVLKASTPARIVNVSSFVHRRASLDFDQLETGGFNAYPQSKLANLLFTYELARRLEGTKVTVNALNPGLVRSNFGLNIPGPVGLLKRLMNAVIGVSPEEGAKTSLYLAISPEVEGVTGKYFEKCKPIGSSPISYDKDAARRLWQVSAELTGLSPDQFLEEPT
jgi:NAD(P)-dependent dehydrogenase (short-subunit alcohol dehydrogenase family)